MVIACLWSTRRFRRAILPFHVGLQKKSTYHSTAALGSSYQRLTLDAVEDIEEYKVGGYRSVHLGDVYQERYRVVQKLGVGGFSTTWLGRDTAAKRYAALKILKAEETEARSELNMLQRLAELQSDHPGRNHVRTLIDHFTIHGPNGDHLCIVTDLAGPSLSQVYNLLGCDQIAGARRLQADLAGKAVRQLVAAVDFLHSHKICHGDLTLSNVLLKLKSIDHWTEDEVYQRLGTPSRTPLIAAEGAEPGDSAPRCTVETEHMPDAEFLTQDVLLADLGQAFHFEEPPKPEDIGVPYMYRAPETRFESVYTQASETWSLACVLFEVRAGNPLFTDLMGTRDEIILQWVQMQGKLPNPWWSAWDKRAKCFDDNGKPLTDWPNGRVLAIEYPLVDKIADIGTEDQDFMISGPCAPLLEPSSTTVPEAEAKNMHDLLEGMLKWNPDERMSITQIREHRWVTGQH